MVDVDGAVIFFFMFRFSWLGILGSLILCAMNMSCHPGSGKASLREKSGQAQLDLCFLAVCPAALTRYALVKANEIRLGACPAGGYHSYTATSFGGPGV
jgi:hypothetical protein